MLAIFLFISIQFQLFLLCILLVFFCNCSSLSLFLVRFFWLGGGIPAICLSLLVCMQGALPHPTFSPASISYQISALCHCLQALRAVTSVEESERCVVSHPYDPSCGCSRPMHTITIVLSQQICMWMYRLTLPVFALTLFTSPFSVASKSSCHWTPRSAST